MRPTFRPTRLSTRTPWLGAALLATLPAGVMAQDADPSEEIAERRPARVSITLGASASYRFESDFDSGSSDVSIARVGADAEAGFLVGDRSRLALSFGTEHSFYDFSPMGVLVPGGVDPFDTIHDYTMGARFTTRINDSWSALLGAGVQSSGESSADFDDTLTYNGLVGASYQVNEKLSIGAAIVISSRLEDDVVVIPVPTITWNIDDRWRLESKGAGLLLSYKASDDLRVGLQGAFERREFRLDDMGPLPSGVIRERRVPVGLWTRWTPAPNISIEGTLGADVYVEFESLNSSGVKFAEDETDPAVYAGLALSIRF
jgi:hypothetical protein